MTASRAACDWLPAAAAVSAAGWGANQFTPLAVVYRTQERWPPLPVAAMFTIYLLGLLPGLLLGGPAADRLGRRRVVRHALVLTAAASTLLAAAVVSQTAVYISRLATGVAAGVILTAGTKWLQELSARTGHPEAGRRRATYATGGGFAAGALAAGALAEWLPQPMVLPCLVHALLALLVLVATAQVPETKPSSPITLWEPRAAGLRRAAVMNPRFVRVVLPASPAVFGAATVAYVVLPPLVADRVPGYAPVFSGLVTALTLVVGMAVQPLAAWLDHAHSARATLVSMVTVIGGLLVGAFAVYWNSAAVVLAAAVLLGAGYGLTLASGLMEIERLAPPKARPSRAFVYQGATYSGFLTPLLLAVTAGAAPYPTLLTGLAAVGGLCLVITARYSRRNLP
ncbi:MULTISPECIES: MFS transporter [Streptomyces]|uniref:MFS transporter n=1 Tax=Streptomyces dengpaensis TaxID=2049881 RepID=A0ABN5HWE0_9ACTN|nr:MULTISPECIES: MFS transporter [Streptomyces]AVH54878.1 MFS transporter [Streptomyces dengpaensis]PIB00286.1 MFS transporter permease [Streptomyces sp. HG99]